MKRFFWNLPVLRGLSPMRRGFAEAVGVVAVATLGISFGMRFAAPKPSAALLRSLAEIGAALLIAYAIETSWIAGASRRNRGAEHENRLGVFLGLGASGLTGIALALALSERASGQYWLWFDEMAFSWVVTSLLFFGITVVFQPLAVHEWAEDVPPATD